MKFVKPLALSTILIFGCVGNGLSFAQDIEHREMEMKASLHEAVQSGDFNSTAILLDQGANVDTTTSDGTTPLMMVAKRGDYRTFKLLISHGAGLDLQNDRGETAMIIAAANGQQHIVEALLAKGADASLTDIKGRNAKKTALMYGQTSIVNLFASR